MNNSRYQLTYPNIGKIHTSDNTIKGIKKCYKDYKYLSDIPEGFFKVTNLDTGDSYVFRKENKKVKMLNKQSGGKDPYKLTLDDLGLEDITRKASKIIVPKLNEPSSDSDVEPNPIVSSDLDMTKLINLNNKVLLDEIKKLKLRIDNLESLITGIPSIEPNNNDKSIYVPERDEKALLKEEAIKKEPIKETMSQYTKEPVSYREEQKPKPILAPRSADSVYEANRKKLEAMESIYENSYFN